MTNPSIPEPNASVDRSPEEVPTALARETGTIADWILGSMSSGILAIDRDGRVAILNCGAQRILGCQAENQSLGKPCRQVLNAQPAVAALLLDTLSGRSPLSRSELVLEGEEGRSVTTIGLTLTPIFDAEGEVRGAAMIFRDLTPFERMDEQQRLTDRLAALGQMAAGLAHEIRNPLAGMEVIAGLLKRRLAHHDEERQLLEQLTREHRRLAQTVTDCLEFVKPLSPERGPANAIELVEDSLATALSRFDFGGTVERTFDSDVPEISVDVSQLRDLITNLIVNAIEAMVGDNEGREKRLRIGLGMQLAGLTLREPSGPVLVNRLDGSQGLGRELVITVSDTGPGVPESHRERIFYPFFTTKQTGSGVGLATAQKIAASHRGALELAPSVGPGATFLLRLQIADGKPW